VRVNRFTGQACYLQPDGSWNSNRIAPPKWLDAYMRNPNAQVSREVSFDPSEFKPETPTEKDPQSSGNNIDHALSQPNTAEAYADSKKEAEKYSLNSCQ